MTLQQILENVSAEISDVRAAVDGRPAGVDVDLRTSRPDRAADEFFELARVGVEERSAMCSMSSEESWRHL